MDDLLIMGKRIRLDPSKVLYDRPFSLFNFTDDWEVHNAQWYYRDGAFWGRNAKPAPGVIISRKAFPGNILMDFYAQTVLPSTHDIDVIWNKEQNIRGASYVAGIQGWWEGKVGIEKSPEYKLNALAPCPWFQPGQEYHVQAGSVDGHCFLFVDGVLRLELTDPEPIDSSVHTRVGFEAYQSMVKISRLTVRQIAWEVREQKYPVEFE
jgi:hypothetical protein